MTDISKAFDNTNEKLLIILMHTCCFDIESLKFIGSYLIRRKQKLKIKSSFAEWREVYSRVPKDISIYIYIDRYRYIHISISMSISLSLYIYIHIYIYIYIYIYRHIVSMNLCVI